MDHSKTLQRIGIELFVTDLYDEEPQFSAFQININGLNVAALAMRFSEDEEQHYKATYVMGVTDEDWRAIGGSLAHFMAKDVEYPYKLHFGLTANGKLTPAHLGKLILGGVLQNIYSRRVPVPDEIYDDAIDNPGVLISVVHLEPEKLREMCKKEETTH